MRDLLRDLTRKQHYATLYNTMQQDFKSKIHNGGAEVFGKICAYCGKTFHSRKSSTLYCSRSCSRQASKHQEREKLHKAIDALFQENQNAVLFDRLNEMEFLSPSMAAIYLGMNRTTIYRYLSAGALPSIQIGNSIRIRKSDIIHLFDISSNPWGKDRELYITVREASEEFGIPYSTVYKVLKGKCLKPFRKGNVDYFLKEEATEVLSRQQEENHPEITKWYTCEEIRKKYLMTETAVHSMVYDYEIPSRTEGQVVYYSQKHVDEIKAYQQPGSAISKRYYTTGAAMEAYGMNKDQVRRLLKHYNIPTTVISRTLHFLKSDFDRIFDIPKFNP